MRWGSNASRISVSDWACAWFDRTLGFMRTPDSTLASGAAGRGRVAALFVEQPRSPQASGRRFAVLRLAGREGHVALVVRVTCLDRDDARSVAVFEQVLASLDVGPTEGAK